MEYHLPEVVRIAKGRVKPVYAPALLYGANLNTWTDEVTQAVAQKMKRVNDQGVTVWLRLLFEMVRDKAGAVVAIADGAVTLAER